MYLEIELALGLMKLKISHKTHVFLSKKVNNYKTYANHSKMSMYTYEKSLWQANSLSLTTY